jgi:hypothetical protein
MCGIERQIAKAILKLHSYTYSVCLFVACYWYDPVVPIVPFCISTSDVFIRSYCTYSIRQDSWTS